MSDFVWLPIPRATYNEFILRSGRDADVAGWITNIVENFLGDTEGDAQIWSREHRNQVLEKEAIEKDRRVGDPKRGLYWQQVFLPNGTTLKMKYQGKDRHAQVQHEKLIYGKSEYSPSEFASMVAGGTSRNAWRDIWIMRPGDKDWTFADDERRRVR